jgi:hypothetical protein
VFCGPGRVKVRDTERYADGSPVVAWKSSLECGAPFSVVYTGDEDDERRAICAERLNRLNAPVYLFKRRYDHFLGRNRWLLDCAYGQADPGNEKKLW